MFYGFADAFFGGCLHVSLVDSVADNEHVVDTDSNEQEGHEVMHSSSLATKEEANSEARSVGQANADETHEGDD